MVDMSKFERAEPHYTDEQVQAHIEAGTGPQLEAYLTDIAREALLLFVNDLYTVVVRELAGSANWPPMWHLSIKRNDKQPIHDWRHLQQIKNMIAGTMLERAALIDPSIGLSYESGAECEGVELYPRESRLVDEANQYHLFVLMHPKLGFPFGAPARLVSTPDEAAAVGAVQRPFGNPMAPLKQPGVGRAERRRNLKLLR